MAKNGEVKLLSGGNPQIPRGYGDGRVQDYIAAMPGWKSRVGADLDEIIERQAPDVEKAIKWNQPFYGRDRDCWFTSFRCYTRYVQIAFYSGSSLDPEPPKRGKHESVRYLDIFEGDEFAERVASWVRQAKDLPGDNI
ncbi:MAG: DUF1801 domain-containing protein [Erythrobacter sp.]|nr:DUF1801 domain-containing protein [Erythrobacter sp.]